MMKSQDFLTIKLLTIASLIGMGKYSTYVLCHSWPTRVNAKKLTAQLRLWKHKLFNRVGQNESLTDGYKFNAVPVVVKVRAYRNKNNKRN